MAVETLTNGRTFSFSTNEPYRRHLQPAVASALDEVHRVRFDGIDTSVLEPGQVTRLAQDMSQGPMARLLLQDIQAIDTNILKNPRNVQIINVDERLPNNPLTIGLTREMLARLGFLDKINLTPVTKEKKKDKSGNLPQGSMIAVASYTWEELPQWKSDIEKEAIAGEVMNIVKAAENAQNTLIQHNLILVRSIVEANISKYASRGVGGNDLVHDGIEGLIHAAEKFDWRLGFAFSTYAPEWINYYIEKGIERAGGVVRIHSGEAALHERLLRTRGQPDAMLAEELGLPVTSIAPRRAEALRFRRPVSLDTAFHSSDRDISPGITLVDPTQNTAETALTNVEKAPRSPFLALGLTERQIEILQSIHVDSEDERDVAARYNLTVAKMRQEMHDGIRKLSNLHASNLVSV